MQGYNLFLNWLFIFYDDKRTMRKVFASIEKYVLCHVKISAGSKRFMLYFKQQLQLIVFLLLSIFNMKI